MVSQNYVLETDNVNRAYSRYLKLAAKFIPLKERLLDIGCGCGFFLHLCLGEGFQEVYGVEPSETAFEQIPDGLRGRVRNAVFDPADFAEASFDIITCFHILA